MHSNDLFANGFVSGSSSSLRDLFANGFASASSSSPRDFKSSVDIRDEYDDPLLLSQLLLLNTHSNCIVAAASVLFAVDTSAITSSMAEVSSLDAAVFLTAVWATSITCFGLDNGIDGAQSSTLRSKFLIIRTIESSFVGTSRSRRS